MLIAGYDFAHPSIQSVHTLVIKKNNSCKSTCLFVTGSALLCSTSVFQEQEQCRRARSCYAALLSSQHQRAVGWLARPWRLRVFPGDGVYGGAGRSAGRTRRRGAPLLPAPRHGAGALHTATVRPLPATGNSRETVKQMIEVGLTLIPCSDRCQWDTLFIVL